MDLLSSDTTVVGMEDPGYDRVSSVFQRVGVPVRSISLDPDGINIDEQHTSDSNLVYVTPSHQYPEEMVIIGKNISAGFYGPEP